MRNLEGVRNIYCDESGYTGRDLLSTTQPYFVYSACYLEEDVLQEIKKLIGKYRIEQGQEVKGIQFVNTSKGQKAIKELFDNFSEYFKVVYHEKNYALASKIIEYGVEPMLRSNMDFYQSKLNEFLALGLYLSFILKKDSAPDTFRKYLEILKGKKAFANSELFDLSSGNPLFEWLDHIISFDPQLLQDEIEMEQGRVGKESLDLVVPSILGLLSEWGKAEQPLSVLCDDSNVFKNNIGMGYLNGMGSGKRSKFLTSEIGYKLAHEIKLGDSKKNYGLQLADLVSSSVFFAMNNLEKDFSRELFDFVGSNCLCTPNSFCIVNRAVENHNIFEERKEYYFKFMKIIYEELVHRYSEN